MRVFPTSPTTTFPSSPGFSKPAGGSFCNVGVTSSGLKPPCAADQLLGLDLCSEFARGAPASRWASARPAPAPGSLAL